MPDWNLGVFAVNLLVLSFLAGWKRGGAQDAIKAIRWLASEYQTSAYSLWRKEQMPVYVVLTSLENNRRIYVKADAILVIKVDTNADREDYTLLEMGAAYMEAVLVRETPVEVLDAIYEAVLASKASLVE